MMLIAGPRILLRSVQLTLTLAACGCGVPGSTSPPAPEAAVSPAPLAASAQPAQLAPVQPAPKTPAPPAPAAPAVSGQPATATTTAPQVKPTPPAPPPKPAPPVAAPVAPQVAITKPVTPVTPAPPAPHHELGVGDAAPSLANVSWLRGAKVGEFKPGTVYVVEFWAPWCPDCRASLSTYANLAAKYKGKNVATLAVAVWPKKNAPDMVRDFVDDASDLFPYPVGEDVDNATAKAWLGAANVTIPTAFVISGDGRIDWIGDPREGLQGAIASALEEAARAAFAWQPRGEYDDAVMKAEKLEHSGAWKQAAETTLALYEQAPTKLYEMSAAHYVALVMIGDAAGATAWAERMLTKDFADKAVPLNLLAWRMVEPGGPIPVKKLDLPLALRIAKRADELTGHSDAYILDTLARAQFLNNDLTGALVTQMRAVAAAGKMDAKRNPSVTAIRKELAERLAEYTAAAEQADSEPSRP